MNIEHTIAVIGQGYVGLPLAVSLSRHYSVIGFDTNTMRIDELISGTDHTGEIDAETLKKSKLTFSHSLDIIRDANIYIITVPTPIDKDRQPDLTPLIKASEMIGSVLKKGDIVVYESTVYPGVTEEECGPILARVSGLKQHLDFTLGYSPERINPGDKEHRFETIIKVVSAEDEKTLATLTDLYGSVVTAGIHQAPSIKVAEAAKVIENTQRDINIALMNELAIIFDRLNIRTADVLAAAGTKWNFLPFTPGLVGGHCIGVDPYYLTTRAERTGYHPQVVLAGRRINDGMGAFIAQKCIKMLVESDKFVRQAKIAILGLTFKENVPDIRNSRVPDIVNELAEFGITPQVVDPHANSEQAFSEYGITLTALDALDELDALILAVPHNEFLQDDLDLILARMNKVIIIDIKSALNPDDYQSYNYWSL